MIMMATAAILGAALGLFVRPRLLGVVLAVLLIGAVEGGALAIIGMLHSQPNRELLIGRLEGVFGEDWVGAIIPVGVAFIGAVLAAVMGTISDPKTVSVLTGDGIHRKAGKDGRYARIQGMVEDRQIHQKAESRIDSILGL
jgi:NADH:ubiquinone oxidoreductase subunit 6 (subunit J)